jgi:hypothetical protein
MTQEEIDAKRREMEAEFGGKFIAIKDDTGTIMILDPNRIYINGQRMQESDYGHVTVSS